MLKELGFFIGVVIAIVLTAIDIVLGLFRYVWGRLVQDKPNFNPWTNLINTWIVIGRHLSYLWKMVFVPSFRQAVATKRVSMHRRINDLRISFGDATAALSDFEYVNAEMAFVVMYGGIYAILGSIVAIHTLVALFTVASLYGVYHYVELPKPASVPQAERKIIFEPQVADKQEADFGPWNDRGTVLDQINNQNFHNIAMLSDTGSVKYSQSKIGDESVFTPLAFTERVVNPHENEHGQIEFEDQTGKKFTVNKRQAFLFEGYNPKVFMFTINGQIAAVDSDKMRTSK